MTSIESKLQEIRPPLASVAPLTAKIVVGFAVANLILGVTLFNQEGGQVSRLAIVDSTFPLWFHAGVFFVLGLFMLYAYIKNDWKLIKHSLVVGIFVKMTWMFSLIFLLSSGGNPTILVAWAFFTYIQVVTYLYFTPKLAQGDD